MKLRKPMMIAVIFILPLCALAFSLSNANASEMGPKGLLSTDEALPVYTDAELITLFEKNEQFKRVRDKDHCQLLQDIEARARITESPAYQFLYGEMLTWGVCLDQNVDLGIFYIREAANNGLPAALLQLGNYYEDGVFLQKNPKQALPYYREAAALGYVQARISYTELLLTKIGSPLDYEEAYRWLNNIATSNKIIQNKINELQTQLANRMPSYAIKKALENTTKF